MAFPGPSKQRFLQSMRQAVRRLTGRFRSLGMDQRGSVLAAGVVILGIFAVLFTAGVRHEGSAQELDIFTAHRRKALDVARGGIDRLLMEFSKDYKASDCTTGDLPSPDDQSTLHAKVLKDPSGAVTLTSIATVAGVRETIAVTLEQSGGGLFEGLFGERTLAAGGTVTAENNCEGSVDSPVYYGSLERKNNAKITLPDSVGLTDIPTVDTVKSAILDRYAPPGVDYDQIVTAIPSGIITQNTLVNLGKDPYKFSGTSEINVAPGAWLGFKSTKSNAIKFQNGADVLFSGDFEVNGSITNANNASFTFRVDGTLIVNGDVSISNNAVGTIILNGDLIINGGSLSLLNNTNIDLFLNGNIVVLGGNAVFGNNNTSSIVGRGMIIAVPPEGNSGIVASNNSTLNIGENDVGTTQLSMITTGKVDFDNNGAFLGSLLLYGKDITFKNNCEITANTASVVSPGNIVFSNNSDVTLRRGEFEDWEDHPDLEGEGGEYRIVHWEEGNRPD
jgi:hypothetical protein